MTTHERSAVVHRLVEVPAKCSELVQEFIVPSDRDLLVTSVALVVEAGEVERWQQIAGRGTLRLRTMSNQIEYGCWPLAVIPVLRRTFELREDGRIWPKMERWVHSYPKTLNPPVTVLRCDMIELAFRFPSGTGSPRIEVTPILGGRWIFPPARPMT